MQHNNEAAILEHYKISSLMPETWPTEKDDEDEANNFGLENDNDTIDSNSTPPLRQGSSASRARAGTVAGSNPNFRSSRYSVLQQGVGRQSTDRSGGVDNIRQRDEPDPLCIIPGMVIATLEAKGIVEPNNSKLRNRYLPSSTTFSSSLFLSNVHRDASAKQLDGGLGYLTRSIEQKSASLKVLVESNFDRFVRAKATIDNVYAEMRGSNLEEETSASARYSTSRQQRNPQSGIYGQNGNIINPRLSFRPTAPQIPNKHALVRETEYGTVPLKNLLTEISVKCQELWGASLGGKVKEDLFKSLLSAIHEHRRCFDLGISVATSIKQRDYISLAEDYYTARNYVSVVKIMVNKAADRGTELTDKELHDVLIVSRMWEDVSNQVDYLKSELWRKVESVMAGSDNDTMAAIRLLLVLGAEENPIWIWLRRRLNNLEQKVFSAVDRGRLEIEVLRRRLMIGGTRTTFDKAKYLRQTALRHLINVSTLDSPEMLDFWDAMMGFSGALLSSPESLLSEVIDFWKDADGVISGRIQQDFPTGYRDESVKHHTLSKKDVQFLQSATMSLMDSIRECFLKLFKEPPPEDVSMLYSPMPSGLTSPVSVASTTSPVTTQFASLTAMTLSSLPPRPLQEKIKKEVDPMSMYAFWPPHGLVLGGTHFLPRILAQLVAASDSILQLSISKLGPNSLGDFRTLISTVRERATMALCDGWKSDINSCRALEDWARNPDVPEVTRFPTRVMAIESSVLVGLERLLYLSESIAVCHTQGLVTPPSTRLVTLVNKSFSDGLRALAAAMVENVTKPASGDLKERDLIVPANDLPAVVATERPVFDYSSKDTRLLLTHSNLKYLQRNVIPDLVSQLENSFSIRVSLTAPESIAVDNSVQTLFNAFISPLAKAHQVIISKGLGSPEWAPSSKPSQPRGYIYKLLLSFVDIHATVHAVTPNTLTPVIRRLVVDASHSFMEEIQKQTSFDLFSLMQAIFDIKFFNQTLRSYTSEKAKAIQAEIYAAMDERTRDQWKMAFQSELKGMDDVLKKLRDNTKVQFACFRKPRTAQGMEPRRE